MNKDWIQFTTSVDRLLSFCGHAVLAENKEKYAHDPTAPSASLPFPDGLLFPSHIWQAAKDPDVNIES